MIDPDLLKTIEETRSKYEFLTFVVLKDNHIRCGIIQNETPKMIMMYDFERLRDSETKRRFLQYGDEWWWQSSQTVPIDSFIGRRFDEFQSILTGYSKKAIVADPIGPTFSITDQYLKRVKKKRIDLLAPPPLEA